MEIHQQMGLGRHPVREDESFIEIEQKPLEPRPESREKNQKQ